MYEFLIVSIFNTTWQFVRNIIPIEKFHQICDGLT